MKPGKRIVFATIGSLGDLHPMLALASELRQRGHQILIASTAHYRERVEALGFAFHPIRPAWDPTDGTLIARCAEIKRGPEVLIREMTLPHLRDTYSDLLVAVRDADLMLAGELVYAAPLIAEKTGLRWASVILSPTSFFSAHDPSLLVNIPSLYRLRRGGPSLNRTVLNLGKLASRHWWKPVRELRRDLGLRVACDPVFKDKFSPHLVLALFSTTLALAQPDWPRQTLQPGFVFYDSAGGKDVDPESLSAFLSAGAPPIVFTQGSTAVHNPGAFYEISLAAARLLGRRALLIGAKNLSNGGEPAPSSDHLVLPYASYGDVFPHASAIVHQGGSGTTAHALRAGRPQLIVPYGWDQPDNGARLQRLNAGLCLARTSYTPQTAAAALKRLLEEPEFTRRAGEAQNRIAQEDALTAACDAVERQFA